MCPLLLSPKQKFDIVLCGRMRLFRWSEHNMAANITSAAVGRSLSDPVVLFSLNVSSNVPRSSSACEAAIKNRNILRFKFMPIKISNKFNRRKSSGNALELGDPPSAGDSSFRVLQRPPQPPQLSHEGDHTLKRPGPARPRTSPNNSARRPYSYFGDGSDSTSNR